MDKSICLNCYHEENGKVLLCTKCGAVMVIGKAKESESE